MEVKKSQALGKYVTYHCSSQKISFKVVVRWPAGRVLQHDKYHGFQAMQHIVDNIFTFGGYAN